MDFLYKDRDKLDLELIKLVCGDILNQQIDFNKPINNKWGAVFVEGRDRRVSDFESFCAIKSFKLHCKYNAPVYCFLHNEEGFSCKEFGLLEKWNIKIIKIPLIDSLEKYTNFWIREIYNYLPPEFIHCLTIQPDGMLLKSGFEDIILQNDWKFIGAHFQHMPAIDYHYHGDWFSWFSPIYGFNGGFSYRNLRFCQLVSAHYKDFVLRERGRGDNRYPMEDIFYSVAYKGNYNNFPTLKDADWFSKDPLTMDIYRDKENWPVGFHFFRYYPEFPPCNHD